MNGVDRALLIRSPFAASHPQPHTRCHGGMVRIAGATSTSTPTQTQAQAQAQSDHEMVNLIARTVIDNFIRTHSSNTADALPKVRRCSLSRAAIASLRRM